jgi:hypothetical protein
MKNRRFQFGSLLLAASVLFGCGTSLGGILGDDDDRNDDRTSGVYGDELRGTVERVNTLDRVILVDAEGSYRNDLRNGSDGLVELRYDDRTVVEHEGRTYHPRDLEAGDRIIADLGSGSGGSYFAERIEVTYDVTQGDARGDDRYASDLRGTVRFVDLRDRIVEVEPIGSSTYGRDRDVVVVHFDDRTRVEFEGRRYTPENLERGDEVEIEISESGTRLIADEITVVRDARNARN